MSKELKRLKAKAWKVFSEYIRQRDADNYGICACVTCGKRRHWKEMHAGHFVKRGYTAVLFDEHNVHAQCPACNTFKGGMQDEYARYIIDTYGLDEFNRLLNMKHEISSMKEEDYLNIIEKYGDKHGS